MNLIVKVRRFHYVVFQPQSEHDVDDLPMEHHHLLWCLLGTYSVTEVFHRDRMGCVSWRTTKSIAARTLTKEKP